MDIKKKLLVGAALATSLAFGAASASAAVYDLGVLTPGSPLSQGVTEAASTPVDYFTFTVGTGGEDVYAGFADFLRSPAFTGDMGLYSGTPGSGTLIGSLVSIGAASLADTSTFLLGPGSYYVAIDPDGGLPKNLQYSVSVFGAAVPEPATWLMMIMGAGLVGAGLRLQRRRPAVSMA